MIADPRSDLQRHAQRLLDEGVGTNAHPCKVCGEPALVYDVLDFAMTCNVPRMRSGAMGVPVYYHRCVACGFVFTSFCDGFTATQWITHIYNEAYYREVDPDYSERRPRGNALAVDALLAGRQRSWIGLDYGGGNGRTAAMLREMGYRYESYDPFGHSDVTTEAKECYDFCSAFEVAEHAHDPSSFVQEIVGLCSRGQLAVLVGTHVNDGHIREGGRLDWWYASPRNGHVSLHSRLSLQKLAQANGLDCVSLTEQTHLFSRGYTKCEALLFLLSGKIRTRVRRALRSRMIPASSP